VHVARVGEALGEQRGVGGAAEPVGEIVQVRPHELGGEHAVVRRALLERPRDRVAVIRLARIGRREQAEELGVVDAVEVLSRLARKPRRCEALEELLRPTGDSRTVEERAQQGAPATRRGTHDE